MKLPVQGPLISLLNLQRVIPSNLFLISSLQVNVFDAARSHLTRVLDVMTCEQSLAHRREPASFSFHAWQESQSARQVVGECSCDSVRYRTLRPAAPARCGVSWLVASTTAGKFVQSFPGPRLANWDNTTCRSHGSLPQTGRVHRDPRASCRSLNQPSCQGREQSQIPASS
jgi:hypothetical protein